jgi:hypothetical protein
MMMRCMAVYLTGHRLLPQILAFELTNLCQFPSSFMSLPWKSSWYVIFYACFEYDWLRTCCVSRWIELRSWIWNGSVQWFMLREWRKSGVEFSGFPFLKFVMLIFMLEYCVCLYVWLSLLYCYVCFYIWLSLL